MLGDAWRRSEDRRSGDDLTNRQGSMSVSRPDKKKMREYKLILYSTDVFLEGVQEVYSLKEFDKMTKKQNKKVYAELRKGCEEKDVRRAYRQLRKSTVSLLQINEHGNVWTKQLSFVVNFKEWIKAANEWGMRDDFSQHSYVKTVEMVAGIPVHHYYCFYWT